jgi:hypothetical protein
MLESVPVSYLMLAGGIVEPGAGRPGAVSAYVALSTGRASRLFKVQGPADRPVVTELDRATTVDLARFQLEVARDLEPALHEIRARGGPAGVSTPSSAWVCDLVKAYAEPSG